jgi:hypothetical protein
MSFAGKALLDSGWRASQQHQLVRKSEESLPSLAVSTSGVPMLKMPSFTNPRASNNPGDKHARR